MRKLQLYGLLDDIDDPKQGIYCPGIANLSPAQVDLAFLMPRMDHNRAVRSQARRSEWAALLASDPFGSESALFSLLVDKGYRGVVNWPSAIVLDGQMRQAMSTIPASAETEYAFLARASAVGLSALAFFRSLDQARAAVGAGLDQLVLHPGLLEPSQTDGELLLRSLGRMIDTLRREVKAVHISVYTSAWHESQVALSELPVDGVVFVEPRA